jgi:hypothetical protein
MTCHLIFFFKKKTDVKTKKKAQSHNPNEMAQAKQRLTLSFKKKN